MIIVTSLSSKHANAENQHNAIESWKGLGDIYTLNCAEENKTIYATYKGVWYRETNKTIQNLVEKPLVTINAMIDHAIDYDSDLLIINSDILIKDLPELKQDGITIFSRWDYTDSFGDANIFHMGFDAFHIPRQFLNIFPQTCFAIGACWHDFYTPYIAILKDIPVYWPQGKHIYHKIHKTQYSVEEWLYMGEHFRWVFKLPKHLNMGQIATDILLEIKQNAIK